MSSDGCSCGSSCKCGDSCSCGESSKFPVLGYSEKITTAAIMISGVAPVNRYHTGSGEMIGSEEGGNACKCGSNCSCDPCKC